MICPGLILLIAAKNLGVILQLGLVNQANVAVIRTGRRILGEPDCQRREILACLQTAVQRLDLLFGLCIVAGLVVLQVGHLIGRLIGDANKSQVILRFDQIELALVGVVISTYFRVRDIDLRLNLFIDEFAYRKLMTDVAAKIVEGLISFLELPVELFLRVGSFQICQLGVDLFIGRNQVELGCRC